MVFRQHVSDRGVPAQRLGLCQAFADHAEQRRRPLAFARASRHAEPERYLAADQIVETCECAAGDRGQRRRGLLAVAELLRVIDCFCGVCSVNRCMIPISAANGTACLPCKVYKQRARSHRMWITVRTIRHARSLLQREF